MLWVGGFVAEQKREREVVQIGGGDKIEKRGNSTGGEKKTITFQI